MKFAESKAEYDKLNNYEYLGRPSPIMQRLLKWDYQYEDHLQLCKDFSNG